FVYGTLASPITLSANTSYYLVSQETAGGDRWGTEYMSVTTTPVASCDGAIFTAPANIMINASANDSDGTVVQVGFFEGANSIGIASTSPYSIPWNNVGPGTYTLTVKATDNAGATTTSSAINI